MLQKMGSGQGFLKAGFLGFAGSGKTHTAFELLIGTRTHAKLDGPLVMFDTEGGSEYWAPRVKARTGQDLIGLRSRSLVDLMEAGREAEKIGAAGFLVDSITHVWREVGDSYLNQINAALKRKNRDPKVKLEFQDFAAIKNKWAEWPDFFLNSKLHIAICGRAGFEWDFQEDESGKKELVKTGTKMKVESEFGFEPSLLIEMEKRQIMEAKKLTKSFVRTATVLKDRFDTMDGASCDDPTFEFFAPHVAMLTLGAHAPIDTANKTDHGVDTNAEDGYRRDQREKTILLEKIQAAIVELWPGQTAAEKKAKVKAIEEAFNTTSWTEVETRRSIPELEAGLLIIGGMNVA